MRTLEIGFALVVIVALPAIATSQAPRTKTASRPSPKPTGSLAQIMRGIYFPNANLIFDVQQHDPSAPLKKSETGGSATDAYSSAYTGWKVVENAAVALTDGVGLILMRGRSCHNGKPVPVPRTAFQKFARDMRA